MTNKEAFERFKESIKSRPSFVLASLIEETWIRAEAYGYSSRDAEVAELKRQRDDLLDACKEVHSKIKDDFRRSYSATILGNAIAAIESKGGKE